MDVSAPHTALCPTLDSSVLTALAGTRRPLTGREVARLLERRSHRGVLDALNRLAEHGLVDRVEAGRALLFTLNREHLAAPAVDTLAGMRAELLGRLVDAVRAWEIAPLHVSLFGSAARGDGDVHSDIDLFMVRPNAAEEDNPTWQAQRDELAERIRRWTGNRAAIAEVSERDVRRLSRQQPPIVAELRSDAVVVIGPPITSLLGTAS
jgi:predicted nucleotidyltransferase